MLIVSDYCELVRPASNRLDILFTRLFAGISDLMYCYSLLSHTCGIISETLYRQMQTKNWKSDEFLIQMLC